MGNFREVLGISEVSSSKKIIAVWKALLAEFLGNFLLNFFGCASVAFSRKGNEENMIFVALTFGLVIFVCVQALGHVSGAHLNPAVTCGMLSVGKITIVKAILYIIVQCVGAIAGSATLKALTPDAWHSSDLGHTAINKELGLTSLQGFGFEFFLGFILVLVVSGVCDENRPEAKAAGPLAIGLTVALGHMGAINITGSSMNPARSFGSAIVAGEWVNHWIYWAGPIAGGIAAALIYHHGLRAPTLTTNEIIQRYSTVATDDKELGVLKSNKDNDNYA